MVDVVAEVVLKIDPVVLHVRSLNPKLIDAHHRLCPLPFYRPFFCRATLMLLSCFVTAVTDSSV